MPPGQLQSLQSSHRSWDPNSLEEPFRRSTNFRFRLTWILLRSRRTWTSELWSCPCHVCLVKRAWSHVLATNFWDFFLPSSLVLQRRKSNFQVLQLEALFPCASGSRWSALAQRDRWIIQLSTSRLLAPSSRQSMARRSKGTFRKPSQSVFIRLREAKQNSASAWRGVRLRLVRLHWSASSAPPSERSVGGERNLDPKPPTAPLERGSR